MEYDALNLSPQDKVLVDALPSLRIERDAIARQVKDLEERVQGLGHTFEIAQRELGVIIDTQENARKFKSDALDSRTKEIERKDAALFVKQEEIAVREHGLSDKERDVVAREEEVARLKKDAQESLKRAEDKETEARTHKNAAVVAQGEAESLARKLKSRLDALGEKDKEVSHREIEVAHRESNVGRLEIEANKMRDQLINEAKIPTSIKSEAMRVQREAEEHLTSVKKREGELNAREVEVAKMEAALKQEKEKLTKLADSLEVRALELEVKERDVIQLAKKYNLELKLAG